jgi:hypothetical protein
MEARQFLLVLMLASVTFVGIAPALNDIILLREFVNVTAGYFAGIGIHISSANVISNNGVLTVNGLNGNINVTITAPLTETISGQNIILGCSMCMTGTNYNSIYHGFLSNAFPFNNIRATNDIRVVGNLITDLPPFNSQYFTPNSLIGANDIHVLGNLITDLPPFNSFYLTSYTDNVYTASNDIRIVGNLITDLPPFNVFYNYIGTNDIHVTGNIITDTPPVNTQYWARGDTLVGVYAGQNTLSASVITANTYTSSNIFSDVDVNTIDTNIIIYQNAPSSVFNGLKYYSPSGNAVPNIDTAIWYVYPVFQVASGNNATVSYSYNTVANGITNQYAYAGVISAEVSTTCLIAHLICSATSTFVNSELVPFAVPYGYNSAISYNGAVLVSANIMKV